MIKSVMIFTTLAGCVASSSPDPTTQGTVAGTTTGVGGGGSAGEASSTPTTPTPNPTSATPETTFSGSYEVPVPPALAAAAKFNVPEVNWSVTGTVVRLAYNLPRGLVGGSLRVDFTGTIDPATNRVTLTGPAGTSECTLTPASVVCNETMRGLLPIAADMGIVQSVAGVEYVGPTQDRVQVAQLFIGDPIGIVQVDLQKGAVTTTTPESEQPHGKGHP